MTTRIRLIISVIVVSTVVGALPSSAEDTKAKPIVSETKTTSSALGNITDDDLDLGSADLSFTASVKAKELKFTEVPHPKVQFTGHPERFVRWTTQRVNLPKRVQQNVTYKNFQVSTQIGTKIKDSAEAQSTNSAAAKQPGPNH